MSDRVRFERLAFEERWEYIERSLTELAVAYTDSDWDPRNQKLLDPMVNMMHGMRDLLHDITDHLKYPAEPSMFDVMESEVAKEQEPIIGNRIRSFDMDPIAAAAMIPEVKALVDAVVLIRNKVDRGEVAWLSDAEPIFTALLPFKKTDA